MLSGEGDISELSRGRIVRFVTGNRHKFQEAQRILSSYSFEIEMTKEKTLEVQDKDLETIAATSVRDAKNQVSGPIIVEDAGLFIESLNSFPGPYSAYVYETLGCEGVLKLLEGQEDRRAEFRSAIAYIDDLMKPAVKIFLGVATGRISMEMRGRHGFGFDPVFIPEEQSSTFGEMSLEEKNRYSHRAKSLKAFASWYLTDPQG
ncbi:MAG: XTP/dITP diphosphatase [Nitrososphaerales archaeon]